MNSFELTIGKFIIWSTIIGFGITILIILSFIIYIKIDNWRFNKKYLKK